MLSVVRWQGKGPKSPKHQLIAYQRLPVHLRELTKWAECLAMLALLFAEFWRETHVRLSLFGQRYACLLNLESF